MFDEPKLAEVEIAMIEEANMPPRPPDDPAAVKYLYKRLSWSRSIGRAKLVDPGLRDWV